MPIARKVRGTIGSPRQRYGGDAARAIREQMQSAEFRLTRLINKINGVTPDALEYGMQPIFNQAKIYTPVDTGELILSSDLISEQTPKGATAKVVYAADGHPKYAVFTHEMTGFKHDPPTRSKFLEAAFYERIDEVMPRVRQFLAGQVSE